MAKTLPLIQPKKLKKGDCIGVIAPAGVTKEEELTKGLAVLKRMGFKLALGEHLSKRKRTMAGEDHERAFDLMTMFSNPEIKGIVCARGGYGSNRILPLLTSRVIRENPKVFVGSSDITALHIFLNQKCSLVSFHGPMAAGSFGRDAMKKSKKQFAQMLMGDRKALKLASRQTQTLVPGQAEGELAGGCLSLLIRSLRTPYEIQTQNKILFIEDVGEPYYKLDAMLCQLKQAGKFKKIKGVVLGEMIRCKPSYKGDGPLEDIFREAFAEYSIPVLYNAPIGHGDEMWTVPFGVRATLDATKRTLDIESCGVS
ncbi:MAG: LD-carboxypeptidase [Candidatus Nitrohelix vancouverensis]|uniref:LD-carboxypeptidase n=1 Tax=Candidatus Nitrohelix vancouverensis TaxID=2705534 RepID=A0A7T0G392_9BACT|nr:MAG: LD-carboxypeptidase [Candidatus Nitrohelix vancouverensis]